MTIRINNQPATHHATVKILWLDGAKPPLPQPI
jgi:hypothetical protein